MTTATATTQAVTVTGEFLRVTAEKGNWFAGLLQCAASGDRVAFCGASPLLPPIGSELSVTGKWEDRGQWGMQLKAERITYSTPTTREGALRVLKTLPGIGESRAAYLVDSLGADTVIKKLLANPDQLTSVPGIGKRGAEAVQHLKEQRDLFEVESELSNLGLGPRTSANAIEHFGGVEATAAIIRVNPYRLVEVERVSFRRIDEHLLKTQRFPADSPFRAAAAIIEALNEQASEGHTWVPRSAIGEALDSLKLGVPVPAGVIETALESSVRKGSVVLVHAGDGDASEEGYTTPAMDNSERYIASYFERLLDAKPLPVRGSVESDLLAALTSEQRRALDLISSGNLLVLTGGPGTGKCLRPGTMLLMYDGSIRAVEDVAIGDLLMGDDSTPRRVLGLSGGMSQMFDVVPTKGDSFGINENHILTYKIQNRRKKDGKEVTGLPFEIKDVPVKDFLRSPSREREKAKLFRVPVEWPHREVPLDPYFLGLWLGDGDNHRAGITNPDHEVAEFLEEFANRFDRIRLKRCKSSYESKCDQYHLTTGNDGRKDNPVLNILRSLNVMHNKHVPMIYKANSREVRLEILAGLLDTDGHLCPISHCFEFTSKDEALFDDTLHLARSLGLAAYKAIKVVNGDTYFRATISGNIDMVPTRIARKKAPPRQQIKNVLHTGFTVCDAGIGQYYGVEVDGNHRHLLADFTVVHNTFTTRAILDVLGRDRTLIAAPTGKAAKRASELTGAEATTIHRLAGRLEKLADAITEGSVSLASWPAAVIIDEASMVSCEIASLLLSALDPRDLNFPLVRIVLVGDVDQLPPIGPGAVLRDCLATSRVPSVRLTHIHRQAEGSAIVTNAHRIIRGESPVEPQAKGMSGYKDWYQVHVEKGENERLAAQVVELHRRARTVFGIDERDIMVLSPQRAGAVGINALNAALREVVNPPTNDPTEPIITMPFADRGAAKDAQRPTLRRGDRVLVTKNDYNLGVVNGDLGIVSEVIPSNGRRSPDGKPAEDCVLVSIDGDDGPPVVFRADNIAMLRHAYCMSVHKSQGSEARAVIVVITSSHYRMLSRRLLYTAVTRAKELLVLAGDRSGLAMAIKGTNEGQRRSRLARLLTATRNER